MYTTELGNYDGIDARYDFRTGSFNHRLSAYVGSYAFDVVENDKGANIRGKEAWGLNLTSHYNDWTFRLAYSHLLNQVDFEAETGIVVDAASAQLLGQECGSFPDGTPVPFCEFSLNAEISEPLDYYSFAMSYDDGQYMMIVEAAVNEVEESALISDTVQGYATFGYHFGDWLPFIGYGREYYKNETSFPAARSIDRDYKNAFLGLRYDIVPGVSAKFQWDHFYDFKGTPGPFSDADAWLQGNSFDKVNIYTFLIDAVF
jgi:hypothetical protein